MLESKILASGTNSLVKRKQGKGPEQLIISPEKKVESKGDISSFLGKIYIWGKGDFHSSSHPFGRPLCPLNTCVLNSQEQIVGTVERKGKLQKIVPLPCTNGTSTTTRRTCIQSILPRKKNYGIGLK